MATLLYPRVLRQREREWNLFMDELSLLQDKLNTLKQRKSNPHDSIEEQLHFIQVNLIHYHLTHGSFF